MVVQSLIQGRCYSLNRKWSFHSTGPAVSGSHFRYIRNMWRFWIAVILVGGSCRGVVWAGGENQRLIMGISSIGGQVVSDRKLAKVSKV